ncbi:MAG: SpoIIE family protein phosphatase [bacterium]
MRFKLRTKLILLTTILVTVIMVDVTYFFTIRELRDKRAAVESQTERIARNIATMQLVDRLDWSLYQNYISQLMAFNDDLVYIAIYDDRQLLRAHTLNLDLIDIEQTRRLSKRAKADIVRRLDRGSVAEESQADLRTQTVNIQLGDRVLGSVHVGFSLIEINNELRQKIVRNVVMALVFLVIFGAISFFLSSRLSRPLERLSAAMSGIAAGNLEQRVVVENRDEIGQLAQTFNEMVEGLRERRIIEKLGHELGATFQLERLAHLIRERLSGAIGATSARLYLRQRDALGVFHEVQSSGSTVKSSPTMKLDEQTQSYILRANEGFNPKSAPQNVNQALLGAHIEPHELVIPMLVKGQLLGLLIFRPSGSKRFDHKQRRFAATLATQAALALENALLYDDLREQERLKRELEIAREVQRKLLPGEIPTIPGFQLDGVCYPAQEVGGDYYDFFRLDDRHIGVVIADVSGKGTSASFYMAEIKGAMSSLSTRFLSPKALLKELNTHVHRNQDRRVFATMIYGVLDLETRSFTFARAGHNSLLHIGVDGGCQFITPLGIGLGLEAGDVFGETLEEVVLSLDPGDTLVLFTDGITEAMNSRKEMFGEERLLEVVRSNGVYDAVNLRKRILRAVKTFVAGAHQHDDLAMVVIQCQ